MENSCWREDKTLNNMILGYGLQVLRVNKSPVKQLNRLVIRETTEELGLMSDLYTPHFLFEQDFQHPDGKMRHFSVFTALVDEEAVKTIKIDTNEVAEIKWVMPDKLISLLETEPGKIIPVSAFALWQKTLEKIKNKGLIA